MTSTNISNGVDRIAEGDIFSQCTPEAPVSELCAHIERSAELAVETEDYLSFATVLDLSLGNPKQFSVDDASLVLATLYKSLAANPVILYKVGWDLPELLLRYIDRFFVGGVENLPEQKPFRLIMALFSLLCENGNPRELLLRACELMMSTESELNSKRMEFMSLKDNSEDEDDDQKQQEKISKSSNIDSAQRGFDVWEDTRQENVKFCTLFEVIRFSLQRIESNVPSSFLLEAARTLLQVADDPNADILSVTTYARRIFLLARDFTVTNEDQVSPEEMQRVRCILVNFLTHATEVVLRKYTLKWAERLYVQMRNKVALAPPNERDFVYTETEYTSRMSEVISRFAQLVLSYDFDPHDEIPDLLGVVYEDNMMVGTKPASSSTKVEGAEVLADNFWSRQLLNGASPLGVSALNTHLHFEGIRSKLPVWQNVAACSIRLQEINKLKSQGVKDMLLYWALWVSNYFESYLKVDVDSDLLKSWLQLLLNLISISPSQQERFVTGSVVARALRFMSPDFAYSFCVDNMKRSNSPAVQFVLVETLKMLITGKISNPEQQQKAAEDSSANNTQGHLCTTESCLALSDERRTEITQVARDAILRLKSVTQALPFYYLNFLTVVPTDPHIMLKICDDLDNISTHCEAMVVSESCMRQVDVLKNASSQLRERTLKSMGK